MAFFLTKFFWGGVLILWGLTIVIEKLFKINIPILRIILGIVLITIGSQILWNRHTDQNTRLESGTTFSSSTDGSGSHYQIYFDTKTIDLMNSTPVNNTLQISAMFSSVTVLVPDKNIYEFEIQNIMSETELPDHKKAPMGKMKYVTEAKNQKSPVITVYLYGAMSNLEVKTYEAEETVSGF